MNTNELTDEEFYGKCAKHLEELHSFPISFEEKRQLYYTIYEGMIRHEELKIYARESEESIKKFGESLGNLEKGILAMMDSMGKIQVGVKIAALNSQIISAKIKTTSAMTKDIAEKVKTEIGRLRGKIDAKDTVIDILNNIRHQEPNN